MSYRSHPEHSCNRQNVKDPPDPSTVQDYSHAPQAVSSLIPSPPSPLFAPHDVHAETSAMVPMCHALVGTVAQMKNVRKVLDLPYRLLNCVLRQAQDDRCCYPYLLLNCGALLARCKPGFLRSLVRESRRRNPACFKSWRRSGLRSSSVLLMP